jgi:hypothetical protein
MERLPLRSNAVFLPLSWTGTRGKTSPIHPVSANIAKSIKSSKSVEEIGGYSKATGEATH